MNDARQATLEVGAAGAWISVQDAGRPGYRRLGVPGSGTLVPALMRIANRLVGNADTAPVLECFDGGQMLVARGAPVRVAVAGHAVLERLGENTSRPFACWRSTLLLPGQSLRVRRLEHGRIVVIAAAGLKAPTALGSASCYARAGLAGTPLQAGQRLPAGAAQPGPEHELPRAPKPPDDPLVLRVIPGPQADHFTEAALATFHAAEYRIGHAADRMGTRLEGPTLAHCAGKAEIVSDATVPGAIQVPGHGLPIVLLADGQTAGGYPKIACVVSVDLPLLAQARPGSSVRFEAIDALAGEAAARDAASALEAVLTSMRTAHGEALLDLAALYSHNLVDGVVDAYAPDDTGHP